MTRFGSHRSMGPTVFPRSTPVQMGYVSKSIIDPQEWGGGDGGRRRTSRSGGNVFNLCLPWSRSGVGLRDEPVETKSLGSDFVSF